MNLGSIQKLVPVGRIFFGIALIVFGVQHFVHGNFVTRVILSWPAWIPGRLFWVYLVGAWLVATGVAIVSGTAARTAALLLGGLALLSFLLLSLPLAAREMAWGGMWTSALKALTLSGGAFVVAGLQDPGRGWLVALGRFCLAFFMVFCGIQHFLWHDFVARLVPPWMPPGPLFWTYFAGIALIAGGIGLIFRKTATLAAALSGMMIFSWVFLVHVRMMVLDPVPNETTATFEALAFSGIAFMLVGERHGKRP